MAQPLVSKHLKVLREVGLVRVRDDGRLRVYRLNGQALKPIHDWVSRYQRLWSERLDAMDELLDELMDELAEEESRDDDSREQGDGRGDAPDADPDPDHPRV